MGHVLDSIAPIVGGVGGGLLGGPIGAAAGAGLASGGLNYSRNHDIGKALGAGALSGGGSYIGSEIGGALGGNLGVVGNAIGPNLSSAIGPTLAGAGVGSVLGGMAGNSVGGSIADKMFPLQQKNAGNYPYVPQMASPMGTPANLSSMSNLTTQQQASSLANQGVYGGGNGPQEAKYFLNLENRRLVPQNGQANPLSSLTPIETTYLSKLGLGGYGDSTSLLKAINSWSPA